MEFTDTRVIGESNPTWESLLSDFTIVKFYKINDNTTINDMIETFKTISSLYSSIVPVRVIKIPHSERIPQLSILVCLPRTTFDELLSYYDARYKYNGENPSSILFPYTIFLAINE